MKFREEDLKVETFRSSGAHGQTVEACAMAAKMTVRLTHKPTGITETVEGDKYSTTLARLKIEAVERIQKKVEK